MSTLLVITDVFVIASGISRRHIVTLAEAVEDRLKGLGRRPLRSEGLDDATWVLLDYGDLVVHLFDERHPPLLRPGAAVERRPPHRLRPGGRPGLSV